MDRKLNSRGQTYCMFDLKDVLYIFIDERKGFLFLQVSFYFYCLGLLLDLLYWQFLSLFLETNERIRSFKKYEILLIYNDAINCINYFT